MGVVCHFSILGQCVQFFSPLCVSNKEYDMACQALAKDCYHMMRIHQTSKYLKISLQTEPSDVNLVTQLRTE